MGIKIGQNVKEYNVKQQVKEGLTDAALYGFAIFGIVLVMGKLIGAW